MAHLPFIGPAHVDADGYREQLDGASRGNRCPNYAFAGMVVRLANMRARGVSGPTYIGVDPLQNGTIAPSLAGAAHTDHIFTTSRSAVRTTHRPMSWPAASDDLSSSCTKLLSRQQAFRGGWQPLTPPVPYEECHPANGLNRPFSSSDNGITLRIRLPRD